MSKRNSLGFLSIVALLVVFMAAMTWYHNELYHNDPGTVSAGNLGNQETHSMMVNNGQKPKAPESNMSTPENPDVFALITSLDLSREEQDQSVELIQNLLKEEEQASQSLNKLLISEKVNASEKISVLQRDFQNKFDQFQLDLDDLIGEKPSEKLVNIIERAIAPLLLQDSEPAKTMNMDM